MNDHVKLRQPSRRDSGQRLNRAVWSAMEAMRPGCNRRMRRMIEPLEPRLLLTGSSLDLSQFKQISTAVNDVQGSVTTLLNSNPIPLLGQELANNISAFAQQFTNLANTLSTDLQNATDNVSDITTALQSAGLKNFNGSQLGTFIDSETGGSPNVEYQAGWTAGAIEDKVPLKFNLGLSALGLSFNSNVTFDIDVTPTFKIDFGVNSNGFYINTTNTGFQLATSVKIDASSTGLNGTLAAFLDFEATDATANNSVYNPTNPSPAPAPTNMSATFSAGFAASAPSQLTISDLNNLEASDLNVTLNGQLNLGLAMKVGFALASGDAGFPTIDADLAVSWQFPNVTLTQSGINTDDSGFGDVPNIAFNNVAVEFGSFITNYVLPIVQKLDDIANPMAPFIDFLNKPAPVFNDYSVLSNLISGEINNTTGDNPFGDSQQGLIQNNVITIGDLLMYGGDEAPEGEGQEDLSTVIEFAQSFQEIYNLLDPLEALSPGQDLQLGDFTVSGDPRGMASLQNDTVPGSMSMTDQQVASESDSMLGGTSPSNPLSAIAPMETESEAPLGAMPNGSSPPVQTTSPPPSGIDFPILRDPSQIFAMLLGKQDVDLFSYNSPTFTDDMQFQQSITVYWPFAIDLHGNLDGNGDNAFDISAKIDAGYDTQGIIDFANSIKNGTPDPAALLDGFYIGDDSNINFNFGIAADGSVNVYAVAAGVGGGLTGNITLSINDPNQATDNGQMQLLDVLSAFDNSIFGPLVVSGNVNLDLNAFVTFKFGPLSHTFQSNLINVNLLNFSSKNTPANSIPALAHYSNPPLTSSSPLVLNMGPDAADRANGDTTDDAEDFSVSLVKANSDGSENVMVSALGYNQTYDEVSQIEGFGGAGANKIEIGTGVDVPVVLGCAFDPNTTTIGPGDGGDTIIDHGSGPYTIYTGLSDDTITVNTGNLNDPSQGGTIYDYNGQDDTIDVNGPIKSGAVNTIQAVGFGSQPAVSGDTITGGPGDDDITVTGSVNLIDSGGGDDNITFTGNPDFDTVVAHDGDNGELTITGLPNANVGNALHVYGTGGQDTLSADDAFNTIPNSHGLYVTAASGSGNSATLESIYAVDSSNQSGISDLVLDATGGDPSTTATAGSLTYVPPSGDIHVNVGTVTNAGVSSVEVNSFASAFPSPNANPTILTISGVPGASVLNFDTEPSTASAGSGTTTTSTVSGTSFTTTISNGTATLETIIFGEAPFDQMFYNSVSQNNLVGIEGSVKSPASLTFNCLSGPGQDTFYVNSVGGSTTINQNGHNVVVQVANGLGSGTDLAGVLRPVSIADPVVDPSSPTGYDGVILLTLDDSQDTANETGAISTFSAPGFRTADEVTGFGMAGSVFFPLFTQLQLKLGSGNDSVTVAPTNAFPVTIQGGSGKDNISATASPGPITFNGGSGNDTVSGSGRGDSIQGGSGTNQITEIVPANPTTSPDTITGGAGSDTIFAMGGNESINGGGGNDSLTYAIETNTPNQPTLAGGAGSDLITVYGATPTIYTDSADGSQHSTDGSDTIQGTAAAATIYGGEGADTFDLGFGTINAQGETINNAFGPTDIFFGTGSAALYAGPAADTVNGGNAQDDLDGFSSASAVGTPLLIASGTLTDAINSASPGAGSPGNADVTVNSGATLNLATQNQTIGSLAGAGNVTLNNFSLTTGADNASTTFTGLIGGSGGLTKTGSGTFICTVPSYTGPTDVQAGTMRLAAPGTFPAPAVLYTFNDPADSGATVTNDGTLANKNGTLGNATEVSGVSGAPGGGKVMQLNSGATRGELLINLTTIGGFSKGVDLSSGSWTASAWFNIASQSNNGAGVLFSGNNSVSNMHDDQAYDDSTTLLNEDHFNGQSTVTNYATTYRFNGTGTPPISALSGWHQLTLVASGGTTTYYLDGSPVGSAPFVSTTDLYAIDNNSQNFNEGFAKDIADVYVFQTALSATQVQSLYQQTDSMPSAVTVESGATFDVNSLAVSIGSLAGLGSVLLGTGKLSTGTNGTSTAFSGTISDSGGGTVTKVGSGIWTVSGTSTYSGAFTASGGTVNFNSLPALGAGSGITVNSATLQYASGTSTDISSRIVTIGPAGATIDTNGSNVTYANSIGNGGSGTFTKAGAGTLTLNALAGWKASTTVNGGTLQAGIANLLPAANDLTVITNGTFDLNNLNQSIGSLAGAGNVTLGSATLTSGAGGNTNSTNFSGVISGSGIVHKMGASILTLSGSNTYSGGTTIDESAQSAGNYGISVASDANLGNTVGNVTFTTPFGVLFTTGAAFNTSRLIFLGTTNSNFASYINVAAGTSATFSGAIANLTGTPAPLIMAGTGTMVLNAANTFGAINGLTGFTIDDGTVRLGIANAIPDVLLGESFGGAPVGATLDLNGFNQRVAGLGAGSAGTVLSTITNTSATPVTLTIDGPSEFDYTGKITGANLALVVNGFQSFNEGGGGGSSQSTYGGGTTVLSGRLRTGYVTTSSSATSSPFGLSFVGLNPVGLGSVTLGAPSGSASAELDLTNGGSIYNPIITTAGSSGTMTLSASASGDVFGGTITLHHDISLGQGTYKGIISGTGNVTTPASTGTVILAASNTYSGNTLVNNGVALQMGVVNALPTGTAVTMTVGASASNFNLAGFNQSIGSLTETSGGDGTHGAVLLGVATLTTGNDNTNTSFAGVITGSGGVSKVGLGTWTITGSSTYTGSTTLTAGMINANSLAALGAGTAVNFGGGTLQYATGKTFDISTRTISLAAGGGTIDTNGNNIVLANSIGNNGPGGLTKAGAGTLTLNAAQTYTGPTAVNAGAITLGTGSSLASTAVSVAGGANLNVNVNGGLSPTTALDVTGTATFAPTTSTGILARSLASLSLHSGGKVAIAAPTGQANRTVLVLGSLTFDGSQNNWGGLLDLASNDLIVHNGNLTNLSNQIAEASNGGHWNGAAGITTSSTTAGTTLNALQNNNGSGNVIQNSFDGQSPLATSDVLIRFGLSGDGNSDGKVNAEDFDLLASNYGKTGTNLPGDFNEDGTVNTLDFNLLAMNFNASLPATAAPLGTVLPASAAANTAKPLSLFSNMPVTPNEIGDSGAANKDLLDTLLM